MTRTRWNHMKNLKKGITGRECREYRLFVGVPLLLLASGPVSAAMCGAGGSTSNPLSPSSAPGGVSTSTPDTGAGGVPALTGTDSIQTPQSVAAGASITEALPGVCGFARDPDDDDIVWRLGGDSGDSASVNGLGVSLVSTGDGQSLTLTADAAAEAGDRTIELVVVELNDPTRRSAVVTFTIAVDAMAAEEQSKEPSMSNGSDDAGSGDGSGTDTDDGEGSGEGAAGVNGGENTADGDGAGDSGDDSTGDQAVASGAPGAPIGLSAERLANGRIQLGWMPADDGQSIRGYNVYRDGSYLVTVFDSSFIDEDAAVDATVLYRVSAFNDDDLISVLSMVASVDPGTTDTSDTADTSDTTDTSDTADSDSSVETTGGDMPPAMNVGNESKATVPTSLTVSNSEPGSIMITWTGGGDDTRGFNVYKNGLYLETVFDTQFTDMGVVDGVLYQYAVTAFDFDNLSTVQSLPVNAVAADQSSGDSADRIRPSAPLDVLARRLSTGEVVVAWHPGDDNVGVAGFNIYRNRKYYDTSLTQVFVDEEPPASGEAAYQIVAFDEARNFSVASVASQIADADAENDAALAGVVADEGVAGEQSLYILNLSSSRLVVFANGQKVGIWPDSLGASSRRFNVPSGMLTLHVLALSTDASDDTVATLQIDTGTGPNSTLLIDDALLGR